MVVLESLTQAFVKQFGLYTLTVTENHTPFSMKVLTSTLLMNSLTTALAIFISFVHTKFSFLRQAASKGKTTSEIRVIFRIHCGHSVFATIDRCIDTNHDQLSSRSCSLHFRLFRKITFCLTQIHAIIET